MTFQNSDFWIFWDTLANTYKTNKTPKQTNLWEPTKVQLPRRRSRGGGRRGCKLALAQSPHAPEKVGLNSNNAEYETRLNIHPRIPAKVAVNSHWKGKEFGRWGKICFFTTDDSKRILTNNRRGSRLVSWDNGEVQATPSGPFKSSLKTTSIWASAL